MPPVISNLANAGNQEQELMPSPALDDSNNIPIGDNKLAYIISDIISNLKSQQNQSRKSKRRYKNPCSVGFKSVNNNQKAVQCDQCDLWSHASCNGISKTEYEFLMQGDDSIPWYCLLCQILNWADIFPFGFLTKSELLDLYGVDLPSELASFPSLEITSRLEKLPHLQDFDLDENLVHSINSNYRKVSDLAKISTD